MYRKKAQKRIYNHTWEKIEAKIPAISQVYNAIAIMMTTHILSILLALLAGAGMSMFASFFLSFLGKSCQLLIKEIAFWAFGLWQCLPHDGLHIQMDTILGL